MTRLTAKNQWGEPLYIGKHKQGAYRGWGDYAINMSAVAVEDILERLYQYEEVTEWAECLLKDVLNGTDNKE